MEPREDYLRVIGCLLLCLSIATIFSSQCEARRQQQPKNVLLIKGSSKKLIRAAKRLEEYSPSDPYYVGSPYSLPAYGDDMGPSSSPSTNPPFCVNPPLILPPPSTAFPSPPPPPEVPSPPFTEVPSPPFTEVPSPPFTEVPSPPFTEVPSPPFTEIPSPPFTEVPSPPFTEVPSPPSAIFPAPTSPFQSSPPPPPPPIEQAPSPPEFGPSPPSVIFPGPPPAAPTPGIVVPSPPLFAPGPPVFLPPVVYPPPVGPPPPAAGGTLPGLWCVAKPTVPDPIIQEAMDYACGSGADCDSILPSGQCYQPDTLLAHASYAFNSYWQRTKVAGGTCDFGGTAMLVTRDPSYDGCQFMLS